MGMVICLRAAAADQLARFRADPSLLMDFTSADEAGEPDETITDLDKAWHAIHFMLTGNDGGLNEQRRSLWQRLLGRREADAGGSVAQKDGLALAILGGVEVGDDIGYGPARLLSPEEVASVSASLERIDDGSFKGRFDPVAMDRAKIYPEIWRGEGESIVAFLLEKFRALKAFYRRAAEHGQGAVLWMS